VVLYDKLKSFGKNVENCSGSVISNRGVFPFLKNNNSSNKLGETKRSFGMKRHVVG
jgi:hypothetical protein